MKLVAAAALIAVSLSIALPRPGFAADKDGKDKDAASASKDDKADFPPLPPEAHAKQSITVNGRTIGYTASIGAIPVRDDNGKVIGQVVYTAYVRDGEEVAHRPVTFAFNGGPGASSAFLNVGAIGPKRIGFGAAGDSPSDAVVLRDNPGTWLDFTDLVFIDPVGTGFSRSMVDETETKKQFYGTKQDIEYLSRIVYDWLVKNGRLASPKYVAGESYGGFRAPRITHYLQTRMGVGVTGVVMVSPYLDSASEFDANLSPLPWIITLPAMAAANLERHGELDAAHMQPVIDYARGPYASDLLKGNTDPAATSRMVAKVTELTGLDPEFVKVSGGRIETQAFLREVFRAEGKLGSRYDSNVTIGDPFPYAPEQETGDPILDTVIAPATSAVVDFDTRVLGWKVDAPYHALNYDVNRMWNDGHQEQVESVTDLRQAISIDPKLHVLIAHGWDDLSCPFMASVLIADQIPPAAGASRVQVKEYPGGHMFYSRPDSLAAFHRDVAALYGAS